MGDNNSKDSKNNQKQGEFNQMQQTITSASIEGSQQAQEARNLCVAIQNGDNEKAVQAFIALQQFGSRYKINVKEMVSVPQASQTPTNIKTHQLALQYQKVFLENANFDYDEAYKQQQKAFQQKKIQEQQIKDEKIRLDDLALNQEKENQQRQIEKELQEHARRKAELLQRGEQIKQQNVVVLPTKPENIMSPQIDVKPLFQANMNQFGQQNPTVYQTYSAETEIDVEQSQVQRPYLSQLGKKMPQQQPVQPQSLGMNQLQAPRLNPQFPQVNQQAPILNPQFPQMYQQAPIPNPQFPQVNQMAPRINPQLPQMNQQAPILNPQPPAIVQQGAGLKPQLPGMVWKGAGLKPQGAGLNQQGAGLNPQGAGLNPHGAGLNPPVSGKNQQGAGFNPQIKQTTPGMNLQSQGINQQAQDQGKSQQFPKMDISQTQNQQYLNQVPQYVQQQQQSQQYQHPSQTQQYQFQNPQQGQLSGNVQFNQPPTIPNQGNPSFPPNQQINQSNFQTQQQQYIAPPYQNPLGYTQQFLIQQQQAQFSNQNSQKFQCPFGNPQALPPQGYPPQKNMNATTKYQQIDDPSSEPTKFS